MYVKNLSQFSDTEEFLRHPHLNVWSECAEEKVKAMNGDRGEHFAETMLQDAIKHMEIA